MIEKLNTYEMEKKDTCIENKLILSSIKFDGRRNNWLAMHWNNKTLITGKYISKKKEKLMDKIDIEMIHYQNKKNSSIEELIIKKCQNENCLIGKWDKEKEGCIIITKKREVIRIKDKKERIRNNEE